ncbi:MAG: O-antigen ligase family protein [Acidobacteria bacterium]|nr:O-antigen ligase family protein [Acidobacteriota bacterium]
MLLKVYLFLLVIFVGLIPAAPSELTPLVGGGIALLAIGLGASTWLLLDPRIQILLTRSRIFRWIGLYMVFCGLSFFVAYLNGTGLGDYLKGLGPNLILLFFVLVISVLGRKRASYQELITMVLVAAVVSGLRVIVELIVVIASGIDLGALTRLSQISSDALSPIFVIGSLTGIALLNYQKRHRGFTIAAVVFLSAISLFSGSRAHLLTLLLGIMLFAYLEKRVSKRLVIMLLVLVGCLMIMIQVIGMNPFALALERINDDESGRINEYLFGLSRFMDSPIWGMGLGFPVPTELIYGSTSSQFLASYALMNPTVGYLHNFFVYLLMDMGVTGLLSYLAVMVFSIQALWRIGGLVRNWGVTSLIILHLFGMTEPSLRHIPSLFLIAIVVAIGIQIENEDPSGKLT